MMTTSRLAHAAKLFKWLSLCRIERLLISTKEGITLPPGWGDWWGRNDRKVVHEASRVMGIGGQPDSDRAVLADLEVDTAGKCEG